MPGHRTKVDATSELARIGLRPRLLDQDLAAAYVGLATGAFRREVKKGTYPKPIADGRRRLWDVRALDLTIDRRSGLRSSSEPEESPEAIMRAIDAAF